MQACQRMDSLGVGLLETVFLQRIRDLCVPQVLQDYINDGVACIADFLDHFDTNNTTAASPAAAVIKMYEAITVLTRYLICGALALHRLRSQNVLTKTTLHKLCSGIISELLAASVVLRASHPGVPVALSRFLSQAYKLKGMQRIFESIAEMLEGMDAHDLDADAVAEAASSYMMEIAEDPAALLKAALSITAGFQAGEKVRECWDDLVRKQATYVAKMATEKDDEADTILQPFEDMGEVCSAVVAVLQRVGLPKDSLPSTCFRILCFNCTHVRTGCPIPTGAALSAYQAWSNEQESNEQEESVKGGEVDGAQTCGEQGMWRGEGLSWDKLHSRGNLDLTVIVQGGRSRKGGAQDEECRSLHLRCHREVGACLLCLCHT